jgi:uncharacterized RDD family membrane protein YckC
MKTKKPVLKTLQFYIESLFKSKESPIVNVKHTIYDQLNTKENWLKRLNAVVVDYFILFAVTLIINPGVYITELLLTMGILSLVYFTATELLLGYTVGKKIFGIKVTQMNGTTPNLKKVLIRNITKVNPVLVLADTIVGYYTLKNHQKYSDDYANTRVVSTTTPKVTFHETPYLETPC